MGIADSLYSQPKYIIHLNDNQQMFIKILSGGIHEKVRGHLCRCMGRLFSCTDGVLVKTMVVGETAKAESRKFSGTVHGYFESPLAFQVGGRITRRLVSSGDRVTAGQVLMTVDSKDASEQAAAAAGALNAAEAQYRLASSTMARYEKLHELQAISDLAMDQTKNQYELASAQLSQAQAALARAENNLGFTSLTADRDGVVGSTLYEVGQVVGAGTPVVLIVDDTKKDIHISFTEKQYGKYSVGLPCTVTFWAFPDLQLKGTVREVAAAPNTSTGTYDAKVTLIDAPSDVVVGMTAEVSFDDPQGNEQIMVPLSAMAAQSEQPAVWIVRDHKVYLQKVETGQYGNDTVEIVSGLQKGDRVVTAGVQKLHEGEEVRL